MVLMIRQKKKTIITFVISIIALCILIHTEYWKIQAYEEKDGTVNGTYVNVRTGAGTSYSKLTYNGENVQLNVGHSVRIIGESNASDGALWYKIKFTYSNTELTGFMHSSYVDVSSVSYVTDEEFEKYLTTQGFPESYKPRLREIHAKYPKWVFVADQLTYDWTDAVNNESMIGRSLVWKDSISSWKSLESGSYNWDTGVWATFDGGSWVAASKEYVSYCMDPRNFLDETYIFQFEMLSFNASIHKEANVELLLKGSFMAGAQSISGKSYATTFMDAAAESSVSPYHLVSRVIQEVGYAGTTGGVTGYYAPSTGNVYTDLYNFYNIGAYAANGRGAVENGLIYASKTDEDTLRPWNTKYKAIVGGAKFIGSGYINIGQDTIYYEKFDFAGTPYTHQYMTNVSAPKSEASKMSKAYTDDMKKSIALVFKIPVFKNMPDSVCTCPTGDGSPNNVLNTLTVDGYTLTPTFSKFTQEYDLIVENSVSSIKVNASAVDGRASVTGTGTISLKVGVNTVRIVVKAVNGDSRTYTINVVRKEAEQPHVEPEPTTEEPTTEEPTTSTDEPKYSGTYTILNGTYLTGITKGTSITMIKDSFQLENCTLQICKSDGKPVTSGSVTTGMCVNIYNNSGKIVKQYSCVIFGDVNGDGEINLIDLLYQKRHILGISKLSESELLAGDVDRSGIINLIDMLYLKRHILGIGIISQ
ncbi:MAG: cadherin-like beta sandwich domain-containing protein [Lachnospiraceae bacterium]|nr:cadherin-like beta sandwich domain-containing protein [Lachnospiraceae bacterium]